ncbi:MAG: hypothetical protein PWR01_3483, partial [Clostridiales bacterium]|nr:hypothetical protein [Clostridiales bacterium]MDN5282410.1 hypothetical protein [Candidatus Ozemobacter sp.]
QSIEAMGIKVTALPGFTNNGSFGYNFFRVLVSNKSSAEREIKLYMKTRYSSSLEYVSRSFRLAVGESRNEALFFPLMDFSSDGLRVEVDGIPLRDKLFSYVSLYRNYYGKKQVLVDNRLSRKEFDAVFAGSGGHSSGVEMSQFEGSNSQLDTNWLSFTQFNALIFYADSIAEMKSQTLKAIFDYLRAGGSMLVLGDFSPPDDFVEYSFKNPAGLPDFKGFAGGFGRLFVVPEEIMSIVSTATADPFPDLYPDPHERISLRGHSPLPFADSELETVSAKWLMIIIYAFAFVIGPVNVYVLHKLKRKIWVFWTVPVASIMCCGIILGYYIVFESSTLKVKKRSFTLLDEKNNRAITMGCMSVFSSASRPEGFKFGFDTEILPLLPRSYRNNDGGKFILLDENQSLTEGWIRPKIPRYLHLRRVNYRRERLTFEKQNDELTVMNGLGADAQNIYFMNHQGRLFECANLKAGAKGRMTEVFATAGSKAKYSITKVFEQQWYDHYDKIYSLPGNYLNPGMYIAHLEKASFFEKQPFERDDSEEDSVVIGMISDGGPKWF